MCGVEGYGVVLHRLGGRDSNRALLGEVRESGFAIGGELVYADCGWTLLSEHPEGGYRLQVDPYTSWQWRLEAGLWEPSIRSAKSPRPRRSRDALGEPVQWCSRVQGRL